MERDRTAMTPTASQKQHCRREALCVLNKHLSVHLSAGVSVYGPCLGALTPQ